MNTSLLSANKYIKKLAHRKKCPAKKKLIWYIVQRTIRQPEETSSGQNAQRTNRPADKTSSIQNVQGTKSPPDKSSSGQNVQRTKSPAGGRSSSNCLFMPIWAWVNSSSYNQLVTKFLYKTRQTWPYLKFILSNFKWLEYCAICLTERRRVVVFITRTFVQTSKLISSTPSNNIFFFMSKNLKIK